MPANLGNGLFNLRLDYPEGHLTAVLTIGTPEADGSFTGTLETSRLSGPDQTNPIAGKITDMEAGPGLGRIVAISFMEQSPDAGDVLDHREVSFQAGGFEFAPNEFVLVGHWAVHDWYKGASTPSSMSSVPFSARTKVSG